MADCGKHLTLLILLFSVSGWTLKAQETPDMKNVEADSYRLFLEQKWDSLSDYCDQAFREGNDYSYLRLRGGIACFELQQYRKATVHFSKALSFNSGDETAKRYLYFCYLYTGEYETARWYLHSLDPALQKELEPGKINAVGFVQAEGAVKLTSDSNYQDAYYTQVGFSHYVASRFSLYHGFLFYRQKEARYSITQGEYYLRPQIPLKNNFEIRIGAHLIYDHLIRPGKVDTTVPPPPPGTQPKMTEPTTEKFFSYAGAFTLVKHTPLFDYSAGITVSNIDSVLQYQANAELLYYPLRNNRLCIGGTIFLHSNDGFKMTYGGFAPVVSGSITDRITARLSYFSNAGPNVIENTGELINNSDDLSTSKWVAGFSVRVTKKLYLYGTYAYENKLVTETQKKYQYNMFLAGFRIAL